MAMPSHIPAPQQVSARIIPFPTALTAPPVQKRGPGRWPRHIVSLADVRRNVDIALKNDQEAQKWRRMVASLQETIDAAKVKLAIAERVACSVSPRFLAVRRKGGAA